VRRTATFVAFVVLGLVVLGLLGLSAQRPTTALDPEGTGPEGARALAEVLRQQGVDVEVVRSIGALEDADPDADTYTTADIDAYCAPYGNTLTDGDPNPDAPTDGYTSADGDPLAYIRSGPGCYPGCNRDGIGGIGGDAYAGKPGDSHADAGAGFNGRHLDGDCSRADRDSCPCNTCTMRSV
jgi:hypothetical protein